MTKAKQAADQGAATAPSYDPNVTVNLSTVLSRVPELLQFEVWIVGDTPLISHAWSEKAKRQMLEKQVGATKAGKEPKDPHQDFLNSLYEMKEGVYGFPAMGVKNSWISAAHKDKNIPKTEAQAALWIHGDIVRVRPALQGAICDMPLIRVYGSDPEMREDMVSVGTGFKKTATLAYRGQFTVWAMKIRGRTNPRLLNPEKLSRLVTDGGMSFGIGEWRPEKKGFFGTFHVADAAEEAAWDAFAAGKGPLPIPSNYKLAAE